MPSRRTCPTLVADRVASRLFAQDHTLWGEAAEAESAQAAVLDRVSRAPRATSSVRSRRCAASCEETGYDRVVLCGMGGSSLAPEVICATAGVPLVVLDSSDPDVVRGALTDLERTVVVVSSKSGSTVETDSQRRACEQAFRDAGIDPTTRLVVVTDPGSPLDGEARAAGFRVVNADPDVGGRYSALTAFGLVPSGLAGADVEALLDDAEAVADVLAADDDANPALRLGAAMGGTDSPARQARPRRRRHRERRLRRLGRAAHRRVHRQGRHRHPPGRRHRQRARAPLRRRHRRAARRLRRRRRDADDVTSATAASLVSVAGPLGAQLLLWEAATAVAGRLLGINPFDQPDVESAKAAARELLDAGIGAGADPAFTDGAVEVRALGGDWLGDATTVDAAVDALLGQLDGERGLRRGHGLPRPRGRRRPRARRPRPVRPHRPSGDVRLGPALPALDRAVPQGWARHRGLRPGDHGPAAGPRGARPRLHLR